MSSKPFAPETLWQFRERTQGFSQNSLPPEGESFFLRPSLTAKVSPSAELRSFYGSTVLFELSAKEKERLAALQEILYHRAAPLFAMPLWPDSFHITLHDLISGPPTDATWARARACRETALRILEEVRQELGTEPIPMRSTWCFNLVNTSVVLGFEPADEEACRRLMNAYCAFEIEGEPFCLGYGLTPHVTLAYYRPAICDPDDAGMRSAEELRPLRDALCEINQKEPMTVYLRPEALCYQLFTDMNHYFEDTAGQF